MATIKVKKTTTKTKSYYGQKPTKTKNSSTCPTCGRAR